MGVSFGSKRSLNTLSILASASGTDARPEVDALKVDLAQARAERDDWHRRHDETRTEIDRISMEQIELEDQLRKQISDLEETIKKKK